MARACAKYCEAWYPQCRRQIKRRKTRSKRKNISCRRPALGGRNGPTTNFQANRFLGFSAPYLNFASKLAPTIWLYQKFQFLTLPTYLPQVRVGPQIDGIIHDGRTRQGFFTHFNLGQDFATITTHFQDVTETFLADDIQQIAHLNG